MNIGKLDKKIIIEQYTAVTTPSGFDEAKWVSYKTVWASINNLWGKEYYAAKATNEEKTVEFTIRYFKDLENLNTTKYRLNWGGRAFNITFIDNIQYANKWLKIKAIEQN